MNPSLRRSSFPPKPAFFLAVIVLVSAVATLEAAEPAPPAAPPVAVAIVSSDQAVQKELLELDRRLEAKPEFEEILRKNIDQLEEENFRRNNPDIDVLLKQQPGIVPALKVERHFLIHRYVARHARGPLLRPDVLALDQFLTAHPDIRKVLDNEPSQILKASFLVAHPSLGEFFDQHPGLSTILLEKKTAQPGPKNE